MNILGINYMGHDASAALLQNGELVAAIEEERFHRYKKHYGGFPVKSIEFCLAEAGIDINELDCIAYYVNPKDIFSKGMKFSFSPFFSFNNKYLLLSRLLYLFHAKTLKRRFKKYFPAFKGKCDLKFVNHHNAHLASAFFASEYEDADILSIDGIGEWETTVLATGKDKEITKTKSFYFPDSIGFLYSAVTRHIGFYPNNDEYKVMGLSGYGDKERFKSLFEKIVTFTEDGYKLDSSYFKYGVKWGQVSRKFIKECGFEQVEPGSKILDIHNDMAAAIQTVTEKLGVHLAKILHAQTGNKRLCMSGGVALNCVMNGCILQETGYEEMFIQPSAYDASGSLGSALYAYHQYYDKPRSYKMKHVFYGYQAKEEEIVNVLENFKDDIEFFKSEDVYNDTVAEIEKQQIIGWYQDKMEWGPRALGNRSILADPRSREMMDIVNDRVKHREDFRPFAPSCKLEKYKEYFDFPLPSPYMLFICDVQEDKRKVIPAVTHVDGTARFHTVEKEYNKKYWNLLDAFEKKTGVPVLLNTSFNIKGETMVMTPKDAIKCFLGTGIDVLVLENYIIKKKKG